MRSGKGMTKIKLGVAQINYKPAFYQSQNDLLVEPLGDASTSISKMSYQGSEKLKGELKNEYISWIKSKVIAIVKAAINCNVQILLFPEYSIPSVILNDIIASLKGHKLIIIAGTHIVTSETGPLPIGYPSSKSMIGTALCPILTEGGIVAHTQKTYRAAEEVNNINLPKSDVLDSFEINGLKFKVKICIDAITGGNTLADVNDCIICIPSLSHKTEPFNALSVLSKYNETPVMYANTAEVGGSLVSGAFSKNDSHWFISDCSTKPAYRGCECLITVSADIDKQHHSVGTVQTVPAMTVEEVYNIFYQDNPTQKKYMSDIDTFISDTDGRHFDAFENVSDPLLAEKVAILLQDKQNGLLNDDKVSNILKYIKVNTNTLEELNYQQAEKVLGRLAAAFSSSKGDPFLLPAMENLTTYINRKNKHSSNGSSSLFEDEFLYVGRDHETASLGEFFNEESAVVFIHGVRGIGKSKILGKIENTVLPTPAPWDIKLITLDKGVGYDYIVDKLDYVLGLRYIERKDLTPAELADKMTDQIQTTPPMALLIDDFHYCTDLSGKFLDKQLGDFFITFVSRILKDNSMKLILTSNRRIPQIINLGSKALSVTRLDDKDIKLIINYCVRKLTNSVKPIIISESTISIIYGNPLAAIIVAQLIGNEKLGEFERRGEVFGKYQEQQIKNLLGEIPLAPNEQHILKIMSVSKTEIPLAFFDKYFISLRSSIDALINRFLIEKNGENIRLHPLLKDFFYQEMETIERTKYHTTFSRFYEQQCDTISTESNPDNLANAIYHFAGSRQPQKLQQYKLKYIDAIKPIADQFYHDKDYEDAVTYYKLIYDTNKELRHDVLIKMAECYVYSDDMVNAKKFFELAIKANPRGAYLYAQYSKALSSKRKNEKLALEIAMKAEDIYKHYGNHFDWEMAQIKFAQGRAQRFTNPQRTLELYAEACELDKTNTYHLCMYAKALYELNMPNDGKKQLDKAERINPKYHLLIRFKSAYEKGTPDEDLEEVYEDDSVD